MFLCSRERILDVVSALKIHLVGLHRSDINTNRYVRSCQILEAKQAGAWIVLGLATITNQLPAKLATFANLHWPNMVKYGRKGLGCFLRPAVDWQKWLCMYKVHPTSPKATKEFVLKWVHSYVEYKCAEEIKKYISVQNKGRFLQTKTIQFAPICL